MLTMRRDLLAGTLVASLVRILNVLRVVVLVLLGLVPGGVCGCAFDGQRVIDWLSVKFWW